MRVILSHCKGNGTKLTEQPCIHLDLLDLRLHRKGKPQSVPISIASLISIGPLINDELATWVMAKQRLLGKHDEQIIVTLTQDFGEEFNLHLAVSRFDPGPGDRTAYFWTDKAGNQCRKEMPPYFISDRAGAREATYDFLVNARSFYLDSLLANSNRLIWSTFEAALRYDPFGKVGRNLSCLSCTRTNKTQA